MLPEKAKHYLLIFLILMPMFAGFAIGAYLAMRFPSDYSRGLGFGYITMGFIISMVLRRCMGDKM